MSDVLKINKGKMTRIVLFFFIILSGTHWVKGDGRLLVKDLSFHVIEPDTSKALRYFQSGVRKYMVQDYTGAVTDFNTVVNLEPSYWEAFRFRGDARRELKQFDLAIADYTQSIALNKSDLLSYRGRAEAKSSIKDFASALKDYNACIELNANDYDAHYGRGISYYELGLYKQSIDDFSFCVVLRPASLTNYSKRAFVYFFSGQYRNAVLDCNRYFKLGGSGKGNEMYFLRGFSYFQMNFENISYSDSAISDIKNYQALGSNKNESNRILGGAYGSRGDSKLAEEYFKKSIALEPNNFLTYSLWGKAELKFNNNAKALELFEKALTLAKNPESDLFYDIGVAKTRLCDITGALADYKKALELDSLNVDVYKARFLTIFRISIFNDNATTLNDINHLIGFSKTKSRTADLYSARSLIYLRSKKNDEAKRDIEKAIELMPSNPLHYVIRGLISASHGEPADVILLDYDRAKKLNTKFWQAYLAKGYLYRAQGETKKACEYEKKAIKHGAKLTAGLKDYLCKGADILTARESPLEFIAYNSLINSITNGDSKTIDCSQGYK
jgi:tetratricopeptide (TPR) repeat protein